MGKNIKKPSRVITKPCIHCFAPVYLKFNLSYITYDEDLNEQHTFALFNRMRDLSSYPLVTILNYKKSIGLETENLKISKDLPKSFVDRFPRESEKKLTIFRIYPNDNPILARVIGMLIKNIMYIFYIDIGGKLYKH